MTPNAPYLGNLCDPRHLHDHDLAEAIVDRVLENGRLVLLDGPSYRTRHLDLPADQPHDGRHQPARFSGTHSFKAPIVSGGT